MIRLESIQSKVNLFSVKYHKLLNEDSKSNDPEIKLIFKLDNMFKDDSTEDNNVVFSCNRCGQTQNVDVKCSKSFQRESFNNFDQNTWTTWNAAADLESKQHALVQSTHLPSIKQKGSANHDPSVSSEEALRVNCHSSKSVTHLDPVQLTTSSNGGESDKTKVFESWCPLIVPKMIESHAEIKNDTSLKNASWFQAGIPREIASEILSNEPVGSFLVRDSSSKPGCYALSLRVPKKNHSQEVANYLITRTKRGYKIKGFTKEFPTITSLIIHHSVMPELLPCPLRLKKQEKKTNLKNNDFLDIDHTSIVNMFLV